MRARTYLVAAAFLALAGTGTLAPAARAAAPRCTISGHAIAHVGHSHVLATKGDVVVYRIRSAAWDTEWACEPGTRRRTLVGHDNTFQSQDNEYGPTTTVLGLQIEGHWVLATLETGEMQFNECSKYAMQGCSGPDDALELIDVATGTRLTVASDVVQSTDSSGAPVYSPWVRTLLSPVGAVAWLTRTTIAANPATEALRGCLAASTPASLACHPALLSTANVDASSLRFTGAVLNWTVDGQPQSATLT